MSLDKVGRCSGWGKGRHRQFFGVIMPTKAFNLDVIVERAAQQADCLITTIRKSPTKDSYMVVFQPPIRATIDISGAMIKACSPKDLVDLLTPYMRMTADKITTFLNEIDEGVVENESDITIEFSLGEHSP